MSVRRFVNTKIWADAWIESLDPIEKLVWLYLLTNDYTNMLGIYQVSMKRIIFETGLTKTQIIKALKGFESVRKAFYWFDEWIFLPNWIKNQSMNPNMLRSATESFKALPKHLIDKLKENGFEGFESLSNGLPILSNIEVEDELNGKEEDESQSERGVGETWRSDFSIYRSECKTAYRAFVNDERLMAEQSRLNPNVNVPLSIEKGFTNFWGTEAGWKHKKKSKTVEIDWRSTIINSIEKNKVYFTREQQVELTKKTKLDI